MSAVRRIRRAGFGLALAAVAAGSALAETGGMCGPADPPVLVILVKPPQRVQSAARGISSARVLVNESDTVIFADGRLVTSSLTSASRHLNTLGWAHRQIEIAGAARAPGAGATSQRGG